MPQYEGPDGRILEFAHDPDEKELQSAFDQDLKDRIIEHATDQGVPPDLLQGIAHVESGTRHTDDTGKLISNPKSSAKGLFQLTNAARKDAGVKDDSVDSHIQGATRYLKSLKERGGSWDYALAAYKQGMGDLETNGANDETVDYAQKVKKAPAVAQPAPASPAAPVSEHVRGTPWNQPIPGEESAIPGALATLKSEASAGLEHIKHGLTAPAPGIVSAHTPEEMKARVKIELPEAVEGAAQEVNAPFAAIGAGAGKPIAEAGHPLVAAGVNAAAQLAAQLLTGKLVHSMRGKPGEVPPEGPPPAPPVAEAPVPEPVQAVGSPAEVPTVSETVPAAAEQVVAGPTRNWRAGAQQGSITFASEEQQRLYDVGANHARSMRTGGSTKGREAPIRRGETVTSEAIATYNDVRAQMKGLKEGEVRAVQDNISTKAPSPHDVETPSPLEQKAVEELIAQEAPKVEQKGRGLLSTQAEEHPDIFGGVAIQLKDGTVLSGPMERGHAGLAVRAEAIHGEEALTGAKDGYVTKEGKFVTRGEGQLLVEAKTTARQAATEAADGAAQITKPAAKMPDGSVVVGETPEEVIQKGGVEALKDAQENAHAVMPDGEVVDGATAAQRGQEFTRAQNLVPDLDASDYANMKQGGVFDVPPEEWDKILSQSSYKEGLQHLRDFATQMAEQMEADPDKRFFRHVADFIRTNGKDPAAAAAYSTAFEEATTTSARRLAMLRWQKEFYKKQLASGTPAEQALAKEALAKLPKIGRVARAITVGRALLTSTGYTAIKNIVNQGFVFGQMGIEEAIQAASRTGNPMAGLRTLKSFATAMGKRRGAFMEWVAENPTLHGRIFQELVEGTMPGWVGKLPGAWLLQKQETFYRAALGAALKEPLLAEMGLPLDTPASALPAELQDYLALITREGTFSAPARTKSGSGFLMFMKSNPLLYGIDAYPRMDVNGVNFQFDHNPLGLARVVLGDLSELLPKGGLPGPGRALESFQHYSADSVRRNRILTRALTGSAMLASGLAFRMSSYAGDKWHSVKWGDQDVDFIGALGPQAAPLFIGDFIKRTTANMGELSTQYPDLPSNIYHSVGKTIADIGVQEMMQGILSTRKMAGLGLLGARWLAGIDSANAQDFFADTLGSYLSWFSAPFKDIKGGIGIAGGLAEQMGPLQDTNAEKFRQAVVGMSDEEMKRRDPGDSFWHHVFLPTTRQVPFGSKIEPLPEKPNPYTGEAQQEETPGWGFLGIRGRTVTNVEREMTRLGIQPKEVYPKGETQALSRLEARQQGLMFIQELNQLLSNKEYQALPVDQQRIEWRRQIDRVQSKIKRPAETELQLTDPEGWKQVQEKRLEKKARTDSKAMERLKLQREQALQERQKQEALP